MIYYIYLITNKVNDKTYIGQRKCPADKFPEQDIGYMGSGKIILQAFQTYGIENFSKETRKKISEAVKGDKNHNYGKCWFNNGIRNVLAENCPEGFIRGMILTTKPWNKGKKGIYSEETRRKMGARNKGNSYTKGCKLSEQRKQRLREVNLGIKKGHWWTNGIINVVCFECPEGFYAGKTHKKRKNIKK